MTIIMLVTMTHRPCLVKVMMMMIQVKDFASCFLFSLETQHTIGWVS